MVEGVLVGATYQALPFSISWTALAWHALLSVVWLWDVFPRWMMSRPGCHSSPGSASVSSRVPGRSPGRPTTRREPHRRRLRSTSQLRGCRARYRVWSLATDSLAAPTQSAGGEVGNRRTRDVGNSDGFHTPPAGRACCSAFVRRLDADRERPQTTRSRNAELPVNPEIRLVALGIIRSRHLHRCVQHERAGTDLDLRLCRNRPCRPLAAVARSSDGTNTRSPTRPEHPSPQPRRDHSVPTRSRSQYSAASSRDTVEGVTCRSPSIRITTSSGSLNL